jgi:hypothetical protein
VNDPQSPQATAATASGPDAQPDTGATAPEVATAPAPAQTIALRDIPTLDIATLTLGEMAAIEEQSGRSMDRILTAGSATRRLLALWVAESRSSARPRSWHELSALRVFGKRS